MAQIKLPFPIRPDQNLIATLTISLTFSKRQQLVAELYGHSKELQENLLNQRINELAMDVAAALGIPYDPEPN